MYTIHIFFYFYHQDLIVWKCARHCKLQYIICIHTGSFCDGHAGGLLAIYNLVKTYVAVWDT